MISVVIPCYNRGALLRRAIESVLAQCYPTNQVIVVDDGSTDDSKAVCAGYGKRIEYVWQENAGASVARNTGVERARNRWVAFLDSDDYWVPSHLEGMSKAVLETQGKARFYFSDLQLGESENSATLWKLIRFVPPRPVLLTQDGTNWAFLRRQPTMLQCSVFDRDFWKQNHGLDRQFRLRHDSELFLRFSIGEPICAVSGVGCVQTDDDTTSERLTTAVDSRCVAYWKETSGLWRSVVRRFPRLPSRYRKIARFSLASAYWRLFRLHCSSRNLRAAAAQLPRMASADPGFAWSLLIKGNSRANCPDVTPEFP